MASLWVMNREADNHPALTASDLLAQAAFVRRLALGLVAEQDVDDIVQETWMAALRRPPHDARVLRPWLRRVTVNAARLLSRRRSRRDQRERPFSVSEIGPSAAELVAQAEMLRCVAEAVMALDEPYRSTILLRFFHDFTPRAIAEQHGVPLATVRSRLQRALVRLREILDERQGGRRESWSGALLAAVGLKSMAAAQTTGLASAALQAAGGILLVSTAMKVATAIVLLAAGAWFLWPRQGNGEGPQAPHTAAVEREHTPPAAAEPSLRAARDPGEIERYVVPASSVSDERNRIVDAVSDFVVEVFHPGNIPAHGAIVCIMHDDKLAGRRVADIYGTASLPAHDGPVDLYVAGVSTTSFHEPLERAVGRHRVDLPAGAAISGTVYLDGVPAREPVAVGLAPYESPDRRVHFWDALKASVESRAFCTLQNAQLTGPNGSFLFSGLPDGWRGSLRFPECYQHERATEDLRVVAPATGVIVELSSYPRVTGRIVRAGSHDPVPSGRIEFAIAHPSSRYTGKLSADAEGCFEVPLRRPVLSLSLDLFDPQNEAARRLELGEIDHRRDLDLGDVELHVARHISFIARDVHGQPVSGAIAALDDGSARSLPTDADGRATIGPVQPDVRVMTVHAHGYRSQPVPIARDRDSIDVTLEASPLVTVTVRTPDGDLPKGVELVVAAPSKLFESGGDTFPPDDVVFELGMTQAMSMSTIHEGDAISGELVYPLKPGARITIADLRAGCPFTLELRDGVGSIVWREELVLAAGERREVEAVLSQRTRNLQGRVQDPQGNALPCISVLMQRPKSQRVLSFTTDETGSFSGGLFADHVDVLAFGDGYAPVHLENVAVPPEGVPLVLTMDEGLSVRVLIRDAEGREAPADAVWVEVNGRRINEQSGDEPRDPKSEWILEHLPETQLVLKAQVGGRVFDRNHDARAPEETVVVPSFGSLDLSWTVQMKEGYEYQLCIRDADGRMFLYRILDQAAITRRFLHVPVLFPGAYDVQLYLREDGRSKLCSRSGSVKIVAHAKAELTLGEL
ncbi:MAG: sigma-70 family RNA polymerase sigma factor [Planctomycetota bacterium]